MIGPDRSTISPQCTCCWCYYSCKALALFDKAIVSRPIVAWLLSSPMLGWPHRSSSSSVRTYRSCSLCCLVWLVAKSEPRRPGNGIPSPMRPASCWAPGEAGWLAGLAVRPRPFREAITEQREMEHSSSWFLAEQLARGNPAAPTTRMFVHTRQALSRSSGDPNTPVVLCVFFFSVAKRHEIESHLSRSILNQPSTEALSFFFFFFPMIQNQQLGTTSTRQLSKRKAQICIGSMLARNCKISLLSFDDTREIRGVS